jgi:hypothetical protein
MNSLVSTTSVDSIIVSRRLSTPYSFSVVVSSDDEEDMSLFSALTMISFDGGGLVGVSSITYVGIYLGGKEGAIPLSWLKLISTYSCEVGCLSAKLSSFSSWSSCLGFGFL